MNKNHHQKGLVNLMVVFAVGLLSLGAVLITATSVATDAQKTQNDTHSDQAFYTAESNMKEATLQYLNDNTYTGSVIPDLNTATNASMQVDTDSSHWPLVFIRGLADKTITNRKILHVIDLFPEGKSFDYPIYSNDDISIGGNATISGGGGAFANDELAINTSKNDTIIDGNALAGGTVTADPEQVSGAQVNGADPIPFPDIDYSSASSPYVLAAQANGTYFSSTSLAENYLEGNNNNALVVSADSAPMNLNQNGTTLTGSLVTFGDLNINGGTYAASSNEFAVIIVGGDFTLDGNALIQGLIYVKGSCAIKTTANTANVTGAILCQNGLSISGNSTIIYDPDLQDAWKNLSGLNTTSTSPPFVSQWNEE